MVEQGDRRQAINVTSDSPLCTRRASGAEPQPVFSCKPLIQMGLWIEKCSFSEGAVGGALLPFRYKLAQHGCIATPCVPLATPRHRIPPR